MDKLLVSSVHPASAKQQLANYLQVPKPLISEIWLVTLITTQVYTLLKAAQSQILS
ncbi:hypothetical protein K435DRAFT_787214 [Dendrothele bispora CBS 962.96]|uniref:Uncharacterized protein n=1 Tax=Dendrothele bispora (strain CBS 962.96) TaxID=1314807 RepID=A0A4S8KMH8_DENBC|nr:hypothetical protein K435DRAFT_787214 [Dendrothele bispora CBS 962.96]